MRRKPITGIFPKASPIRTLRETREETGLSIPPERLLDLGRFSYRRDKDLYLFAVRLSRTQADIAHCTCSSLFAHPRDGRMIPEMDAYRWTAPEAVPRFASGSLTRLFTNLLSLSELHQTLPAAAMPQAQAAHNAHSA